MLDQFAADPGTAGPLCCFAGGTTACEGVNNQLPSIGKHPNEEFRDFRGKTRRMRSDPVLATEPDVHRIAFGMDQRNQVRWDRRPVIHAEPVRNVVARRT